jgi:uncharacterized membrane protein
MEPRAHCPLKTKLNIMKRKIALIATLLTLAGTAVYYTNTTAFAQGTPPPATGQTPAHERHPAIRHAIQALEKAKVELKNANHDFGGHREDALKECDAAIAQLKLALQYDKN